MGIENHMNSPINDSLLSLIIRFVDNRKEVDFCANEFIQKQIMELEKYVGQFPKEEENYHALEWIEKYAKKYREKWELEIISREFIHQRCPDCPLSNKTEHPCQIHHKWLNLLSSYIQDQITSRQYVEHTLQLLEQHKEFLKVRMDSAEQLF